jgi:hypothetical protein
MRHVGPADHISVHPVYFMYIPDRNLIFTQERALKILGVIFSFSEIGMPHGLGYSSLICAGSRRIVDVNMFTVRTLTRRSD